MPFADFQGNADVVRNVREMLARDHFPHAVILSGAPVSPMMRGSNAAV